MEGFTPVRTSDKIDWATFQSSIYHTEDNSIRTISSTSYTAITSLTITKPGYYFISGGVDCLSQANNEIHDVYVSVLKDGSALTGSVRSIYGAQDRQITGRCSLQTSIIANITTTSTIALGMRVSRSSSQTENRSLQAFRIG